MEMPMSAIYRTIMKLKTLTAVLTLTDESSIIRMFYGLMSLCMMLRECNICKPCVTVRQMRQISLSSIIHWFFFAFPIRLLSRSPWAA